MKYREKILQELSRRLKEVDWYENRQLTSQDLAKSFFTRIADYMNYVKSNKELSKFCDDLEKSNNSLEVNNELLEDGNRILDEIKQAVSYVESLFKKHNFTPLAPDKINPTQGTVTLSSEAAVSLMYWGLKSFLTKENQSITEIPSEIGSLFSVIGSLGTLGIKSKKLDDLHKKFAELKTDYEEKIRKQTLEIAFLRYSDYRELLKVWKYYYDKHDMYVSMSLDLATEGVLSGKTTYPHLGTTELRRLEKERENHLLNLHRFHNYLVDRLEENVWWEEATRWFWDKMGAAVFTLIFAFILFWIAQRLGVNAPVEEILKLIKP